MPSPDPHHDNLPPPIPVRDYHPSSSQIALDPSFYQFGGGVNPLAYKGYNFYGHGPGFGSSMSIPHAPPVRHPIRRVSPPKRQRYPVYIFNDDDEDVLSINVKHPSTPQKEPHPNPNALNDSQQDHFLCCPLFGSITPFVEKISLSHVGCSTVLPAPAYLLWRALILLASVTVLVITALDHINYLSYIQGAAIVFTIINHILLLRRALVYRHFKHDNEAIVVRSSIFGWNAFVFQGALHLCVMVAVTYSIHALVFQSSQNLSGEAYIGSLSSYFLLGLTVLLLIDVFITPIPFRATHILPMAVYSMLLSSIAMWGSERTISLLIALLVGVASVVSGILLHLMGRSFYLFYHEERIAAENLIKPTSTDQYVSDV